MWWELLLNLWNNVVEFLGHPGVRVFTTIVGIASAAAGLWAAIKAQKVLHAHRQQILVTQQQSLNDQWQKIDAAMLSNESVSEIVSHVVGADNIQNFRQYIFHQLLVNLLFQAAVSRVHGTLSEEVYSAHFASVAYFFRNRADLFFLVAVERYYTAAFIEDCRRRFAKLEPLTKIEMCREIHEFTNLLDQADGRQKSTRTVEPAPRVSEYTA